MQAPIVTRSSFLTMMKDKLKLHLGIFLVLFLSTSMVKGQDQPKGANQGFSVQLAPTYNYLYSTHGTKYKGFGLNVETSISNRVLLGLGAEKIYCPYHYDNGLNLSKLHLVPIYGMLRYKVFGSRWVQPYFKLAVGITLMDYDEQKARTTDPTLKRSDKGLYTYGALGTTMVLTKGIDLFLDFGMVGYKMSLNDLDINPHGVSGKTGLLFTL